jgi:actin-like ATPase involved in cell morphogenesis
MRRGYLLCMTAERALTDEELAAQGGAALPDKEAMSTITADIGAGIDNFAMPINEATAMNIASSDSYAIADADQIVILDQIDTD